MLSGAKKLRVLPCRLILPLHASIAVQLATAPTRLSGLQITISTGISVLPTYYPQLDAMNDYNFGGADEENAELKKLNAEVVRISLWNLGTSIADKA